MNIPKNKINRVSEAILMLGVEMYGDSFNLDDETVKNSYKKMYVNLRDRAINEGKKSKKGALVIGGIGVGKSAMMKIMQRLFKDTESRFKWVNAYELKDLSEVYTTSEIKEMYGYDLKCDLYIDDIGVSLDVKRYGNTVNIISELLMERYDLYINSGYRTHLSSNLKTDILNNLNKTPTLKSMYGSRLLDRIKEMNEINIFKGNSKRV